MTKFLGFYLGLHDSNISMYDTQTKDLHYVQSERLSGIKRHRADWKFVESYCAARDFIPDVVCFSDGNRNGLGDCPADATMFTLPRTDKPGFKNAQWINVDHHFAHIMSAWPVTPMERIEFGIAIDGRGDHERRVSVFTSPSSLAPPVFATTQSRVGHLFDQIGIAMKLSGHKADFAGKVMGAQAYGQPDLEFVEAQMARHVEEDLLGLLKIEAWHGQEVSSEFFTFANRAFRDWLASVHLIVNHVIRNVFQDHIPRSAQVTYSGGCALNTIINQDLSSTHPFIVIPPHCHDGGISLGCLEIARLVMQESEFQVSGFPFIQQDEDMGHARARTIERAAEALAGGAIIGWLQGRGEIGPRALGHRSLLMNPALPSGKDILNSRVKHREAWRPFGPSVLFSRQTELFASDDFLPYMLRTVPARASAVNKVPAIVHRDNTSRIQSVADSLSCSAYLQLMEKFASLTGVPAVLNTSYNPAGGPIVGNRNQALSFFQVSDMDVLVIGDQLIER
jgi:carbamoyltransferase